MSPTRKSPFGVRARAMVTRPSEASMPETAAPRSLARSAAKPDPQAMSSNRVPSATASWSKTEAA